MTNTAARDEMFALLRTKWVAEAPAVVGGGYTPDLQWPGVAYSPPPNNRAFGRVSLLTTTGRQSSLASAGGVRRWERRGVLIVQCFGPLSVGNAYDIAERLATIARNAFEGQTTPGGVWFRDCRTTDVGPDKDGWFGVNAVAEFIYDEVK